MSTLFSSELSSELQPHFISLVLTWPPASHRRIFPSFQMRSPYSHFSDSSWSNYSDYSLRITPVTFEFVALYLDHDFYYNSPFSLEYLIFLHWEMKFMSLHHILYILQIFTPHFICCLAAISSFLKNHLFFFFFLRSHGLTVVIWTGYFLALEHSYHSEIPFPSFPYLTSAFLDFILCVCNIF